MVAVRIKRTPKFSAGILKGVVRRFEVWTAGAPGTPGRDKPMCMTNRMPVGGSDPLAALIVRVIEDLKQRTAANLAGGATLEGEGWRLAAMQLSVARGRIVENLPFVEIDKVAVFDGKICVWRRGQDEPAAKISPDSKNASVLASLSSEWIEHQREALGGQPEATSGTSGMGRLLFERRRNNGSWLGLVFAIIGSVAGVVLLFEQDTLIGVVLLAAAMASLLLGLAFGRYVFRCYESGLTRRRGRDELRLSYDEIAEFTYAATRMFYKGAYTGTQLGLTFRAPRGTIRYSAKVQNLDADLDELRDHIAKTIATRMLARTAGRPQRALDERRGLPAPGLAVPPCEDVGACRRPGRDLALRTDSRHEPQRRPVYLYSKAEVKPVISKAVGTANFFPGFFAVLTLQGQAGQGGHE